MNKSFLEEEEAKEKIVIKKKKQITSQYSNFSFADPAEVNIAINQVNSTFFFFLLFFFNFQKSNFVIEA